MSDYFNRMSVATIKEPEFLNITSISPLVSKCEVKVLYVGENRNRSYISKQVATEMAQTLPGVPIVGQYIQSKEDFGDHGDQVVIDGEGVKFNKLTKPYGFVAPNARIWFQEFEDTDEFGNKEIREYLMTEGFLWTEQFEECKRVVDNGNPQSMELDEKTLKGHWSNDNNCGIEFFIINDAVFSKLCILGEDVEPCFEGASVTNPQMSSRFSLDDDFKNTLFSMMNELKTILNKQGGSQMTENNNPELEKNVEVQDNSVEFGLDENQDTTEGVEVNFEDASESTSEGEEVVAEEAVEETVEEVAEEAPVLEEAPVVEEFAKADDEKKDDEKEEDKDEEDKKDEEEYACSKDDEDKKKYELAQEELETLKSEYALLKEERDALAEFKANVENEKKDEMINSFYMLSDEDKADVVANKTNYTVEQIKEKLSVICFDKKVNFDLDKEESNDVSVTFNLNETQADDVLPDWLKAVKNVRENQ